MLPVHNRMRIMRDSILRPTFGQAVESKFGAVLYQTGAAPFSTVFER
jgi:hypothetical protein